MSSIQDRGFVPPPLPLRGPDYSIKVDREGLQRDYSIVKRGDEIRIDRPLVGNDVLVKVQPDQVDILHFQPGQDVSVRKDGNHLTVSREGGSLVTVIEVDRDRIAVRRRDPAQEVVYLRQGDDLLIDRFGVQNDVALRMRNGVLSIDRQGKYQDLTLTVEGLQPDPVTFRSDTTVDPVAWGLLQKWFDRGASPEDLVRLTQDGQVDVIDWLLA